MLRWKTRMDTHFFYISSTFISNTRLKSAKNEANAKQYPEAKLYLFDNYSHSSSKENGTYSKNKKANVYLFMRLHE